MGKSKIEWLTGDDGLKGATWNPIKARLRHDTEIKVSSRGGIKIDSFKMIPAGKTGYAEAMNGRTLPAWGTGLDFNVPNREKVEIFLDEEVLLAPLKWKAPTRIFPCSMTDMFAEFVPEEFIERMFAVMALCPQHTFLVLTKRAQRMYEWTQGIDEAPGEGMRDACIEGQAQNIYSKLHPDEKGIEMWLAVHQPLANIHMGVSVENQEWADKRIPWLIKTPAAVRWLSYEPALGPIDWSCFPLRALDAGENPGIDWAVIGAESGPGARPYWTKWQRDAIEQFGSAGVPLFCKQMGPRPICFTYDDWPETTKYDARELGTAGIGVGEKPFGMCAVLKDRKGGDMSEWPPELRVRQYPAVRP